MFSLLVALLLVAQDTPLTNLTISGAETALFTTTDTNACYLDDSDNVFNAQLFDAASQMVISVSVLGTVGDHPAVNQLTALSLDGPDDDPLVNWNSTGGTVTLDDIAASVPIESGDPSIPASTHGVLGHIEADLASPQGTLHMSGPFACHSPL